MITFAQLRARIGERVSGFDTPLGGISWVPQEAEITAAKRVIKFLEDRRVLYELGERQVPKHCTKSVLQIREFLTSEIGKDPDTELSKHLESMRAACRKFLGTEQTQKDWQAFDPIFSDALEQLRGVFGEHIALIALKHKLDVEPPLESILPEQDKD